MHDILTSLSPVLIALFGLASKSILQMLRRASAAIDALPAWQKAAVNIAIVGALAVGRHFLPGTELPGTLEGWTPDVLTTVLGAVVGHFAHKAEHAPGSAQPEPVA